MGHEGLKPVQIVGNWKMNKTIVEARAFISTLALTRPAEGTKVALAVPFTCLSNAAAAARGSMIAVGAQDVSAYPEGPFTGETSAAMVADAGGTFTLIGHSECRQHHHDNDSLIAQKIKAALQANLRVILCVGESLEQRKEGRTEKVIKSQIEHALADLSKEALCQVTLAYEPIWAIGTGESATVPQVKETHRFIREVLKGDGTAILYGGSVKAGNAKDLLALPNVDGLLVGGASLSVDNFTKIIHSRSESVVT